MHHSFRSKRFFAALWTVLALQAPTAFAADITATPPAGGGFVVKDSTGTTDRFRVQESGTVTIPGLPGAASANTATCFNNLSGQLGPCAAGSGTTNYAYVYNNAAQVVALEADILFDSNGALSAGVTHTAGTSPITITTAGTYEISWIVSGVEPNQFALFVNGAPATGGIFGTGAGTQQNSGHLILSVAPGDVVTLRNHSSSAAVTLQTLAGGTQINVNASILIRQLN